MCPLSGGSRASFPGGGLAVCMILTSSPNLVAEQVWPAVRSGGEHWTVRIRGLSRHLGGRSLLPCTGRGSEVPGPGLGQFRERQDDGADWLGVRADAPLTAMPPRTRARWRRRRDLPETSMNHSPFVQP